MSDQPAVHVGESFRGVGFRDCDLTEVRIVDSVLSGIHVAGYGGPIVVNDVDVTEWVQGELDRRHPERVRVREIASADDLRSVWRLVEGLWADTVERARRLSPGGAHASVHGEWSFVETQRHLVFATDAWLRRTVLDEEFPFDPLGYPATGYPEESAAALGLLVAIEPEYQPGLDEILVVRAERMAAVSEVLDGLTDDDFPRSCERPPAPGYPSPHTVRQCLGVIVNEEVEHHRYATRDLSVIETSSQ
jgi:hypothetical protein